jgi:hypothetical protein
MKTLNKVKSFFKKQHPKEQYVYAVTAGAYLGELLVYMDSKDNSYNFLILPNMAIRQIPREKFDIGLKNNIVEAVEKLPSYVYGTCKLQYKKNKSSLITK